MKPQRRPPAQADMFHATPAMTSTARFSDCGAYRYELRRVWQPSAPVLAWIMLNPSTATAEQDDPTVAKCRAYAERDGFGGIVVVNIFAWRSTDPRMLPLVKEPVGPENDAAILRAVAGAGLVVCAWGNHGQLHGRGCIVEEALRKAGAKLHRLVINKTTGEPGHPLYLRMSLPFVPWED
jgi:hypothetical protein